MKKLLLLIIFLLPVTVDAGSRDSTAARMATSMYEQLHLDTTGTGRLPRFLAIKYAQIGIGRVGWNIGKDTTAQIVAAAGVLGVLVDTALIRVIAVYYDSAGYSRRALTEVPNSEISKLQFLKTVTTKKNATRYGVLGDSILLGPISLGADTFTVVYFKKYAYLSDSTTATELPMEHREAALAWALYKASERLQNGRQKEFRESYFIERNDIWGVKPE